jgi:hypothetical protein
MSYGALHEGRLDEVEQLNRRALELLRAAGDTHGLIVGYSTLGVIARTRGDLDESITQHHLAIEAATEVGDPHLRAFEYINLAMSLT